MNVARIIKAGETILVTNGESDDYRPLAVCRALVDLDIQLLQDEYYNSHTDDEREWKWGSGQDFMRWLVKSSGKVEVVPCVELWLANSRLDNEFFKGDRVEDWEVDLTEW